MFKYAIWLSIACATLVEPAAISNRAVRSIWPFTWYEGSSEIPLMREDHVLLLKRAGLDKTFNLSSHPLWKVHKYEGIDLKPVYVQTEIIKSNESESESEAESELGASVVEAKANSTEEEAVDLSFLDDLGGLADFLPDPKDEEDEATDLIADAIKKEEKSHPGFFKKLWWKIWGAPQSSIEDSEASAQAPVVKESQPGFLSSIFGFAQSKQAPDELTQPTDDSLDIYLPETQGSYAAVVVPKEQAKPRLPALDARQAFREPANEPLELPPPLFQPSETHSTNNASHLGETPAGASSTSKDAVNRPVARWPSNSNTKFSRSQAWTNSWSPHASYNVHVQSPALPSTTVEQQVADNSYQRKISQDAEQADIEEAGNGAAALAEPEADAPLAEKPNQGVSSVQDKSDDNVDQARDILSSFQLPEGLLKKLQVRKQDVDDILNDKESAARAAERLRALQKEFEMRKEQLSYVYSSPRRHNPIQSKQ